MVFLEGKKEIMNELAVGRYIKFSVPRISSNSGDGLRLDNQTGEMSMGTAEDPPTGWRNVNEPLGLDQLAGEMSMGTAEAGPSDWRNVHGKLLKLDQQAGGMSMGTAEDGPSDWRNVHGNC